MSKRHKVEGVFKLLGVWWKHVKYKKDGEWRHCYDPKHTYHTIFSKKRLTKDQIKEILNVH